jgi:hypothetical protein
MRGSLGGAGGEAAGSPRIIGHTFLELMSPLLRNPLVHGPGDVLPGHADDAGKKTRELLRWRATLAALAGDRIERVRNCRPSVLDLGCVRPLM